MTLAQRNIFIKTSLFFLIVITVLSLLVGISLLTEKKNILFFYKTISESATKASTSKVEPTLSIFTKNINLTVVQNILFPCYSFLILLSVYFLFEKTYVVEISFFMFFAINFSLESLKLIIPFFDLWNFFPKAVFVISRFIYFLRFSSILILLTAAVFVVAPITRRITPVVFAIIFLSVALTLSTPFNTSNLTFDFLVEDGLQKLSKIAFWFFTLFIFITYFIAGKTLDAKEYVVAAFGSLAMLVGWFMNIASLSFFSFVFANSLFVLGTILYLRGIHKYNMWQ